MAHFNVFVFVDIIITMLGIYVIISAFLCKKKEQLSSLFLPPESRISDMKGMTLYMFPRILIFGVICIVYGVSGFLLDVVLTDVSRAFSAILTLVFIIAYVWFSMELRKARGRF